MKFSFFFVGVNISVTNFLCVFWLICLFFLYPNKSPQRLIFSLLLQMVEMIIQRRFCYFSISFKNYIFQISKSATIFWLPLACIHMNIAKSYISEHQWFKNCAIYINKGWFEHSTAIVFVYSKWKIWHGMQQIYWCLK